MRNLTLEGPVPGQLPLPHLPTRKANTMTTATHPTSTPTMSAILLDTRDALLGREAQRADALARTMAEAEQSAQYGLADDLRATINEDRAADLEVLLDLLTPCLECDAAPGAPCGWECESRAHSGTARLAQLDLE